MRVIISRRAQRFLDRCLDARLYQRIETEIDGLAQTPFPQGCKKLAASGKAYRVRVGDYRILYQVANDTVIIEAIGHRREVYR